MQIEQVKLLKTLKFGRTVWIEGSFFPNKEHPSIPSELMLEILRGTGTVEITKQKEEKVIPPKTDNPEQTSVSSNVNTSVVSRASLEEAKQQEKAAIEAAELPKSGKLKLVKKSKSKLVRRQ